MILWDSDGTLIRAGNSPADVIVAATEIFLDRDLPTQERSAGKTDRQTLCELLEAEGNVPSGATLGQVLGILNKIPIKEINQYPFLCNPGVATALKMATNAGWVNGLLTGNTPVRARAKLKSTGIWKLFDQNYAYFGHQAPSRGDLVAASAAAIRSAGCSIAVVIGDTPLDVRGAQEHELQVVFVATQNYSVTE